MSIAQQVEEGIVDFVYKHGAGGAIALTILVCGIAGSIGAIACHLVFG
jgi:hypothetical protein